MTYTAINAVLKQFKADKGVEYAYHQFKTPPKSKNFIAYFETAPDVFAADNKSYFSEKHFEIELYTTTKQPELEDYLMQLFSDAGEIAVKGAETYIDDENIFMNVFSI